MKIPVFASCPTLLTPAQEEARSILNKLLAENGLEPRTLGQTDYPVDTPLKEVLSLARHCAGGVVLGFGQLHVIEGIRKPGTSDERPVADLIEPTVWNHIEAGILFALGLPLLVFREEGISGGVFSLGTTDVFVQRMPRPTDSDGSREALGHVIRTWSARVFANYHMPA